MAGALVLNSGYEPIKVVGWRKAIVLWFQGKVEVLEFHQTSVSSPSQSFRLPAVLRLKHYVRPYFSLSVRLSRANIFLRDRHECQYCRQKLPEKKLTVDHVVPLSKGGRHEWTNVVTACSRCNNRKGDGTPERADLRLGAAPGKPRWLPSRDLDFEGGRPPPEWRPYLAAR